MIQKNYELPEQQGTNHVILKMMDTTPYQSTQAYIDASPIYQIKKATNNPMFKSIFFVIWGEKDEIVSPAEVINFIKVLKEYNVNTESFSVPDQGNFWLCVDKIRGSCSIDEYPNTIVSPEILKFLKAELTY
ncbi:hypothetical protein [Bacillus sp. TH50]|uniref:hypothetical protein n=1 Tax=Bacillus sp. TH50 TaxID=2796414 RepID=UPI001A9193CC|nr:hypothetical protein [Bacillus sp. TH50]